MAVDGTRVHTAAAMPEVEWRDAWKKYFKVTRITRQFVVVPSWETYEPQPEDVVINLDPGMAFGTGNHASTRLVLEHLQVMADAGAAPSRVLDVGCGSGILTIAAIKRWPNATAVAIDNDPIAVQATAENALANKVADRVDAMGTPIGELIEAFPLVVGNIQAHVLREIKASLIKRCSGTLILSGLLTPQAQPLADEFVAAGMKLVKIRASAADAEWSSVVLEV